MKPVESIMRTAPVIPVLVIDDVAHARPIAEALVAGGLKVLEVTLRTEAAIEVIQEMSKVEGAIVGAGTVLDPGAMRASIDAGAQFIVSPGFTERLGAAAVEADVAFLPGVANAGDIMRGMDLGLWHFKFFPAETSGGLSALKSLTGPFGAACFCPTGGITETTAPSWLMHPSVLCVGGSWIVPSGTPDVEAIRVRATAAAALNGGRGRD